MLQRTPVGKKRKEPSEESSVEPPLTRQRAQAIASGQILLLTNSMLGYFVHDNVSEKLNLRSSQSDCVPCLKHKGQSNSKSVGPLYLLCPFFYNEQPFQADHTFMTILQDWLNRSACTHTVVTVLSRSFQIGAECYRKSLHVTNTGVHSGALPDSPVSAQKTLMSAEKAKKGKSKTQPQSPAKSKQPCSTATPKSVAFVSASKQSEFRMMHDICTMAANLLERAKQVIHLSKLSDTSEGLLNGLVDHIYV